MLELIGVFLLPQIALGLVIPVLLVQRFAERTKQAVPTSRSGWVLVWSRLTWTGALVFLACVAVQFPFAATYALGSTSFPPAVLWTVDLILIVGPMLPTGLLMKRRAASEAMWRWGTLVLATPGLSVFMALLLERLPIPAVALYVIVLPPFYVSLLVLLAQLVVIVVVDWRR